MERGVRDVREKARVRRGREKARAAKASIIVWTVRNAEGRLCFSDERAFREVTFCEHKIQVPFALNRPSSSSSCAQNTHQVSPARAFAPRARDTSPAATLLRTSMRRDVRVWRDAQWGRATHARTRRHRRGPAEPSSMNDKHYAHRGTLKARPRVHGSDGARCLSKPISSVADAPIGPMT
jgi:hypothetical protein